MVHTVPKPTDTFSTVSPLPRSTSLRLSPISFAPSPTLAVVSVPSLPLSPQPQQTRPPLSRTAQVECSPAEICTAVLPLGRSTKSRLSPISPAWSPMELVLPMPSSPYVFDPQQATSPSTHSRQVWLWPADTWEIPSPPLRGRSTSMDSEPESPMVSVDPMPSLPSDPSPQHLNSSLVVLLTIEHECAEPTEIEVAFHSGVAESGPKPSTGGMLLPISW